MLYRALTVMALLLGLCSGAYADLTTTGAGSNTGGSVTPPGTAPNIGPSSFMMGSPATAGDVVPNTPIANTGGAVTTWSITSCSTCTGYFSIDASTGVITVTSAGAAAITGSTIQQNFSPVVKALNATGFDTASQTITFFADGRINAPTCTVQFPSLLNGYAVKPSWQVAGVNYCVGPPSSTVFKVPGVDPMPAGCTANSGTHIVTCSSGAPTLDGWDFSDSDNGWTVACSTAGLTVKNSKFKLQGGTTSAIGTNNSTACTGLTITQNLIDGNGADVDHGVVWYTGSSASSGLTLTYNYILNSGVDLLNIDGPSSSSFLGTIKYNLLQNAGEVSGAHGDVYQPQSGRYNINISFNTILQQNTAQGAQGLNPGDNSPTSTAGNVSYNTMIASAVSSTVGGGSSNLNAFIGVGPATITTAFPVQNNYFDPKGLSFNGGNANDCSRCFANAAANALVTYSGNINMNNGRECIGPGNGTGCAP